jgi:flagellar biosynthesis protein FlhF
MNSTIRTFRAATAEEALAQVRREMGLAAEVLDVKRVSSRGLFAWLSSRQEFEVRAIQPAVARQSSRSSSQQPRNTLASNAGTIAATAAAKPVTSVNAVPVSVDAVSAKTPARPRASNVPAAVPGIPPIAGATPAADGPNGVLKNTWSTISSCSNPEETRHVGNVPHVFQQAPKNSSQRDKEPVRTKSDRAGKGRSDLAPPPPLLPELPAPRNRLADLFEEPAVAAPHTATSSVASTSSVVGRSSVAATSSGSKSPATVSPAAVSSFTVSPGPSAGSQADAWQNLAKDVARTMMPPGHHPSSPAKPGSEGASTSAIEQRLETLQQMIADLGRRTASRGLIEIPHELFPHYLTLIEADVEEDLARELIQTVHRHASPGQLADTASTMALLTALLEQRISCDRALAPVAGRRQIAMVVGPTGVGKTTTLAKLAGSLGVQQGCRLGLITVDTYRVAAVEQLRTYAEIIDLPMRVVANAAEMQEALDSLLDCDLVLIDTAGRSPHDDRRLTELNQLIEAARPDHVYLVLSLASGANALRATAERFAAVRPTSLVFTKLDEAAGCGGLLSAARDIGLPVSYFTTGQEVPRDIEPANPCRAARLILGTDSVNRGKS